MSLGKCVIATHGEQFYPITDRIRAEFRRLNSSLSSSGILYLFILHTSCGLLINENYDESAQHDMEAFLDHLAPRNLKFIQHTLEGEDDSPSHMKAILTHQNLALLVEKGEIILGQWQGVFLAEFRDQPKKRTILLKFLPDPVMK